MNNETMEREGCMYMYAAGNPRLAGHDTDYAEQRRHMRSLRTELTLEDGASTYINGICIYIYIYTNMYIYIYI